MSETVPPPQEPLDRDQPPADTPSVAGAGEAEDIEAPTTDDLELTDAEEEGGAPAH